MKILDVNLLGAIEVTLSPLSLMRKARDCVVNIFSVGGSLSIFGEGYCISKWRLKASSDSHRYWTRTETLPFPGSLFHTASEALPSRSLSLALCQAFTRNHFFIFLGVRMNPRSTMFDSPFP